MVAGVDDAVEAGVALVYVGGATLVAGAIYLSTPAGQRAADSLGEAMYDGAAGAVGNVVDAVSSVFSDDAEKTKATPITDAATQECDGPHGVRIQVQGYKKNVDPYPLELSWAWNRPCIPPLRPEGLSAVSATLLPQTAAISYRSAGLRGPAFSAMSRFISKSSSLGFRFSDSCGWSITETGKAVKNGKFGIARNAPRVDMEIHRGRAFGDK